MIVLLLVMNLLAPFPAAAEEPSVDPGTASPAPTISSDLDDYPPGGLVTLTGTNWQPGELVRIVVNDDWGSSWRREVDVVADASGVITDQFNLPDWFVATYSVVATGPLSGVATTSFTDGSVRVRTVGAGGNAASVAWIRYSTTNCTGGVVDSGSISAGTTGNGTDLPVAVSASQSVRLTAGTIAGYVFSHWSGGSFNPASGNPTCLTGTTPTQNTQVNYTAAPVPLATSLAVSPVSGTFAGSVTLGATLTLTAGGSPVSGKTVSFALSGSPVGSATTNASGVATLTGVSLGSIGAGSYPAGVSASFAGDATHAASSGTASLTIGKAATVTTVTCPAGPFVFTGVAQEPCSAQVTGPGGLSQALPVSYANNTDTGTATASANYAESANYLGSSDSETFVISKADPVCTVSGGTWTYDGDPHGASGSCLGVKGETLAGLDLGATFTNVPGGTANWTFTDATGNYNDASGSVAIVINKAATVTTLTCAAGPFVYTGEPHTPCSASVTGPGGLSETLTVSYSNNTNAGTATASASFGGGPNHLASSDSETFEIGKADATCTVIGYVGWFDGAFHGATGSCVGIGGENPGTLSLGSTFRNVPGGTAHWTFTGNGNYEDESGSVAIQILPWNASGHGFYQPVGVPNSIFVAAPAAPPAPTATTVWNVVRGGQTVPLKFNVYAGSVEKTSLADIAGFTQTRLATCTVSATDVLESDLLTTGGTTLRYADGQWIQNWQTPRLAADACFRATVRFADGSSLSAFFRVRR
jgi:hypothetical protein